MTTSPLNLSFCCIGTPIETEKFRSNGLNRSAISMGWFFSRFFGTWYHFIFIYYIHIYKSQKKPYGNPHRSALKMCALLAEVSALLGRIPSAVGYQPTLATDLASLQEPDGTQMGWKDRVLLGCWWKMMELVIWQCVKTLAPSEHQNFAGFKWMFIPLKMVLIGIDP